jgi:hypothetical protein
MNAMTTIVQFLARHLKAGSNLVAALSGATRHALGLDALESATSAYERALAYLGEDDYGTRLLALSAWLWELEDSSPLRTVPWSALAERYESLAGRYGAEWSPELQLAVWPS